MNTHPDPSLDEVRRARMALSERFDHDLRRLCAYLRQEQKKHPGRISSTDEARGARYSSGKRVRRAAA